MSGPSQTKYADLLNRAFGALDEAQVLLDRSLEIIGVLQERYEALVKDYAELEAHCDRLEGKDIGEE